jgi:hypothetical protein
VKRIRLNIDSPILNESSSMADVDSDDEYFEKNINSNDSSDIVKKTPDNELIKQIRDLGSQEKIPFKSDILEYYQALHRQKKIDEIMYKMVMVVLSAPATQVSVERSFSGLAGLLVQKRNKLSSANISDVLLCHLNRELIEHVDFENMNWSSE